MFSASTVNQYNPKLFSLLIYNIIIVTELEKKRWTKEYALQVIEKCVWSVKINHNEPINILLQTPFLISTQKCRKNIRGGQLFAMSRKFINFFFVSTCQIFVMIRNILKIRITNSVMM